VSRSRGAAQDLRSVPTSVAHGRYIKRNHDLVADLCALWLELMNLQLAGLPVDDGDNLFEHLIGAPMSDSRPEDFDPEETVQKMDEPSDYVMEWNSSVLWEVGLILLAAFVLIVFGWYLGP
jgi:hypothetical protein